MNFSYLNFIHKLCKLLFYYLLFNSNPMNLFKSNYFSFIKFLYLRYLLSLYFGLNFYLWLIYEFLLIVLVIV